MSEPTPSLFGVHVNVCVKADAVADFVAATLENATNSLKEPLVEHFELSQRLDDACKFIIVEVYKSSEGLQAHCKTAHYLKWRETVQPMMAADRSKTIFNTFPGPRNPIPTSALPGQRPLAMHVTVTVNPDDVDAFIAASLENAKGSIQEEKVTQFELSQEQGVPTSFRLYEVYADDTGPLAHKDTAHYQKWREVVQPMMAAPRSAIKALVASL
eukprot:m.183316 g.183316  ORF g.183316 m.183316 type:complete len:214 (-) comp32160_c8_seq1:213-854(-)